MDDSQEIALYDRPNMGSTIHFIDSSLSATTRYAIKSGLYSFQFFLGGNMGFKRAKLSKEDIQKTIQLRDHYPMNIYSHMPYCYNLCGSVKCLAWNGDKSQDKKSRLMIEAMKDELLTMGQLNNRDCGVETGCVVHIGSYGDKRKGIETVATTINKLNKELNSEKRAPLLLENCAGEGTKLGVDVKELYDIYSLVEDKRNLGICIDTCHLFGAGTYDFGKISEIDRFFKEFDTIFGTLEPLKLIHFNDSDEKYKSKRDKHQKIGEGYIWDIRDKKRREALQYFIYNIRKIPSVLETWVSDYDVIQTI